MIWSELASALCLVLVIEGILPFLSPRHWRSLLVVITQMSDRDIRVVGLCSMLVGVGILMLIR